MKLQLFKTPVLASASISASTLTSILTSILTSASTLTSALILTSILTSTTVKAQVGFGTNAANPNAIIDLFSSTKGLLIPRVALTATNAFAPLAANVAGMLLYNTATAGTAPNAVTPGFYYNNGTIWVRVADAAVGWVLTGNAGTTPGTNFIGTTDDQDLVFKRDNSTAGLIGKLNAAFGVNALLSNTSGIGNSAFGSSALLANVSGNGNSAFGFEAFKAHVSGSGNVAFGARALLAHTTGDSNTAVGVRAIEANKTGFENTAVGNRALNANVLGSYNTVLGTSAMEYAGPTGDFNTAVGHTALSSVTGSYNIGLGHRAGQNLLAGNNNTAIGLTANLIDPNGSNQLNLANLIFGTGLSGTVAAPVGNIGIGTAAPNASAILDINTNALAATDKKGVLLPQVALANVNDVNTIPTPANGLTVFNTTAAGAAPDNVTVGYYYYNTTTTKWVKMQDAATPLTGWSTTGNAGTTPGTNFIGTTDNQDLVFKRNNVLAGRITNGNTLNTTFGLNTLASNVFLFNTTGFGNSAFGTNTLSSNTTGVDNSAFGAQALNANTIGKNNVAVGSSALLRNTTGINNIAIGYLALGENVIASNNVAIGAGVLYKNLRSGNTAVGSAAMTYNELGFSNTALGADALKNNINGAGNVALGAAVFQNIEGEYNTGVGYIAGGNTNVTGNFNVAIGANTDLIDPNGSNQLNLANLIFGTGLSGTVAAPLGNIGIGTAAPNASAILDINTNTLAVTDKKGVLLPQVALADVNDVTTIPTPANGLTVFNTTAAGAAPDNVTVGYYYYNTTTTKWVKMQDAATPLTGWSTTGNAGTTPSTNFIGTTDNQDLIFRRNNIKAGLLNDSQRNTSFGVAALNSLTTGEGNTAVGFGSLEKTTIGESNAAFGFNALYNNLTGSHNIAVGTTTLANNTTGRQNIAIGHEALRNSISGNDNIAIGYNALLDNTIGSSNIAFGQQSLQSNTSGQTNTALGSGTLASNTTGDSNVALGANSLSRNTTGSHNIAIGTDAVQQITVGNRNIAIGPETEFANPNGSNQLNLANLIFGTGLGGTLTAPVGNIGIGTAAPNASAILDINTNTLAVTDKKGVLLPQVALADVNDVTTIATPANGLTVFNTTAAGIAPDDVTVGYYYYNTTTTKWVKMQDAATPLTGWSTTGNAGTDPAINFIGTTDNQDLVFKRQNSRAGFITTNSTAFGNQALEAMDLSVRLDNTAFGGHALLNNTTGAGNTALGRLTLTTNTTGGSNTALGYSSGSNNTTGSNNTVVGSNAQVPDGTADNQVRIGNGAITYAGVEVAWTITSDKRLKSNIKPTALGLDFIKQLNPVSYYRNTDKNKKTEYGFIAQEVAASLAKFNASQTGLINTDSKGMYSMRYNDLISPMVKAIQQQQTIIETQNQRIAKLEALVKALAEKIK